MEFKEFQPNRRKNKNKKIILFIYFLKNIKNRIKDALRLLPRFQTGIANHQPNMPPNVSKYFIKNCDAWKLYRSIQKNLCNC